MTTPFSCKLFVIASRTHAASLCSLPISLAASLSFPCSLGGGALWLSLEASLLSACTHSLFISSNNFQRHLYSEVSQAHISLCPVWASHLNPRLLHSTFRPWQCCLDIYQESVSLSCPVSIPDLTFKISFS